jgi:hypothetical protein
MHQDHDVTRELASDLPAVRAKLRNNWRFHAGSAVEQKVALNKWRSRSALICLPIASTLDEELRASAGTTTMRRE